jgi:hypothetical protein
MTYENYDRYGRDISYADIKYFKHCRFKGGGSTTVNNTSTYTPSAYELQLQKAQANYADAIAPNSLWLNDTARQILQDSIGAVQVDFNGLNNAAQNQISGANFSNSNLANGVLPTAYTDNMTKAIQSGVQNTYGDLLNKSAQAGVLNSSVTNRALDNISKNVSDTMAKAYNSNISQVSNLNNNNINNATAGITTAAAAQEAAQQPALNLWNASLGLNGATTGALAAASGKGTTHSTSTQTTSGGGGFLSGLLGGL